MSKFPIAVLFPVSMIVGLVSSTLCARFAKKNSGGFQALMLLECLFHLVSTVVLFALNGFRFHLSAYTLFLSVLFGAATMGYNFTNLQAYKFGPYGYTVVIVSLSMVINVLFGFLLWGEPFGICKTIGIVLMVFCFVFAVDRKESEEKSANIKWFLLSVATMLLCAFIGILQKIHQSSVYKEELMSFLIFAFILSTAGYLIVYLIIRRKSSATGMSEVERTETKRLILFTACIAGGCSALNNCLNLYLAGVLDSSIMFPIVQGCAIMGGIVVSFAFFKEKLSKKQLIGLIIGIAAIAFLCV